MGQVPRGQTAAHRPHRIYFTIPPIRSAASVTAQAPSWAWVCRCLLSVLPCGLTSGLLRHQDGARGLSALFPHLSLCLPPAQELQGLFSSSPALNPTLSPPPTSTPKKSCFNFEWNYCECINTF